MAAYRNPREAVLSQWTKKRELLTPAEQISMESARERFCELDFYIRDTCELVDYGNYHGTAGEDRVWPDSCYRTINDFLADTPCVVSLPDEILLYAFDGAHADLFSQQIKKSDDLVYVTYGWRTKILLADYQSFVFQTHIWASDFPDQTDPYIAKEVADSVALLRDTEPSLLLSRETLRHSAAWKKKQKLVRRPMSELEALQKVKEADAQRWNRIMEEQ